MAGPTLAGFLRNEGRFPASGSEWADNAMPRAQRSHGRVYHPDMLTRPPPANDGFLSPGFADFLRNFLPQGL